MSDKISKGKLVSFTYKVYDDNSGELLFEAGAKAPDVMVHGFSAEVLPGLQQAMEGLGAGDRFSVTLPPEAAFGNRDERNVIALPRDVFGDDGEMPEEVKVGAVLPMMTEGGQTVVGTVLEIGPSEIRMDFNHPFAGKTVRFDGEVADVRDATEDEKKMAQGRGGCCGGGCHGGGCHGHGEDGGCGGHGDSCCGGHGEGGCGGCHE